MGIVPQVRAMGTILYGLTRYTYLSWHDSWVLSYRGSCRIVSLESITRGSPRILRIPRSVPAWRRTLSKTASSESTLVPNP